VQGGRKEKKKRATFLPIKLSLVDVGAHRSPRVGPVDGVKMKRVCKT